MWCTSAAANENPERRIGPSWALNGTTVFSIPFLFFFLVDLSITTTGPRIICDVVSPSVPPTDAFNSATSACFHEAYLRFSNQRTLDCQWFFDARDFIRVIRSRSHGFLGARILQKGRE